MQTSQRRLDYLRRRTAPFQMPHSYQRIAFQAREMKLAYFWSDLPVTHG
jgi:hypothetical protein